MNAMHKIFVFTVLLILPLALATQASADQASVNVLFLVSDDLNDQRGVSGSVV